ncbi:hypothetical protein [Spirosoma aerophilum]
MNNLTIVQQPDQTRKAIARVWSGCLLLYCALIAGCHSTERDTSGTQTGEGPHQITPAFYHWKSTFDPGHSELEQLKGLKIQKLYIHFFDVDWDNRARRPGPKALVTFRKKPVGDVVPVVFITNRTLLNMTPAGLSELATHVTGAIKRISQQNGIVLREVQFDCDWSPRTRDRYFRLLTLLAKQLDCPLSATIRLHQIKYTDQTGVPPVARGMLMLYNVADWKRVDTRNSIYDSDVANQYLSFVSTYPLALDVVLPLFRWTVVYRSNRFLTFINSLDRKALKSSSFLAAQADSMRFVSMRDTIAWGLAIRRGDLFRAEAVTAQTLLQEKERLLRQIHNPQLTFAVYHLDSTVLSAYPRETLQTLLGDRPRP